jgi:hypothetical protein
MDSRFRVVIPAVVRDLLVPSRSLDLPTPEVPALFVALLQRAQIALPCFQSLPHSFALSRGRGPNQIFSPAGKRPHQERKVRCDAMLKIEAIAENHLGN